MLNDLTYENATGDTVVNPLARGKSLYRTTSQGLIGDDVFTQRFTTQLRISTPQLKDDVEPFMDNPNYMSFQSDFDFGAHGAIHVLVGGVGMSSLPGGIGDMRSIVSASFDPLF